MESGPMVRLTTVDGAFAARVVAARLGADGILVELRGAPLDPVYPLTGSVDLYVSVDELETARDLLAEEPVPDVEGAPPVARPASLADRGWVYAAALVVLFVLGAAWLRELLDWMQR